MKLGKYARYAFDDFDNDFQSEIKNLKTENFQFSDFCVDYVEQRLNEMYMRDSEKSRIYTVEQAMNVFSESSIIYNNSDMYFDCAKRLYALAHAIECVNSIQVF